MTCLKSHSQRVEWGEALRGSDSGMGWSSALPSRPHSDPRMGGRWGRQYPAGPPASWARWLHTHQLLGLPLFLGKMGSFQGCAGPREASSPTVVGRLLSTEPHLLPGRPPARYSLTCKALPPFPQGCLLSCRLLLALLPLRGQHGALGTDLDSEKAPCSHHFPGIYLHHVAGTVG